MLFAAMMTVSGKRSTTVYATRLVLMMTSVVTMVMIAWTSIMEMVKPKKMAKRHLEMVKPKMMAKTHLEMVKPKKMVRRHPEMVKLMKTAKMTSSQLQNALLAVQRQCS